MKKNIIIVFALNAILNLNPLVPQSACTARMAPAQVQNAALALVKLHVVDYCQLQFVEISVQGRYPIPYSGRSTAS